jgi:hypothetical protein
VNAPPGACAPVPPARTRTPSGRDDGFWAGRCACGWASPAARATVAEADADASAHRAGTTGQLDGITGVAKELALWRMLFAAVVAEVDPSLPAELAAGIASTTADRVALADAFATSMPALGTMASEGERWIITAAEHERRAVAYRSGADLLTAELRRRLDAAWELMIRCEAAGPDVPAAALRGALEGARPDPPDRPVTGGGPDASTTKGNGTDANRPG